MYDKILVNDIKNTLENVIKSLELPEPNKKKLDKCVEKAIEPPKKRGRPKKKGGKKKKGMGGLTAAQKKLPPALRKAIAKRKKKGKKNVCGD